MVCQFKEVLTGINTMPLILSQLVDGRNCRKTNHAYAYNYYYIIHYVKADSLCSCSFNLLISMPNSSDNPKNIGRFQLKIAYNNIETKDSQWSDGHVLKVKSEPLIFNLSASFTYISYIEILASQGML